MIRKLSLCSSVQDLSSIDNRANLKLGHKHIRLVPYKKSLGVVLDKQLKWYKHNEVQCKKNSNSVALLKRVRPFVPRHALIKMYMPLFYLTSTTAPQCGTMAHVV